MVCGFSTFHNSKNLADKKMNASTFQQENLVSNKKKLRPPFHQNILERQSHFHNNISLSSTKIRMKLSI